MSEAFGRYVSDEQRYGLAEALMRKGYDVSTREHGGWGGGTEWVVRRWRTKHHLLAGWIVPCSLCLVAAVTGHGASAIVTGIMAMFAAIAIGMPEFSVSFMWWDGEDEWDVMYGSGNDEFEALIPVIEESSGRKVRRRKA